MIRIPRRGRARAYLSAAPRSRVAVDSLRICISEVKDLPSPKTKNQKPKTHAPRANEPSLPGRRRRARRGVFSDEHCRHASSSKKTLFEPGASDVGFVAESVRSLTRTCSPPTRNHLVVLGPVGRYFLALGARARDTPRARRCPPASPRAVPAAPPPRSPPRLLPRCPRRRRARSARPCRASSPSRSRGSFFSRPRRTPRAAPRAVRSPRATTPSRRPWRPLLPSPPP